MNLKEYFEEHAVDAVRGSDFQKFMQKVGEPSHITETCPKARKKTQIASLSNILIEGVFKKGGEGKRKLYKPLECSKSHLKNFVSPGRALKKQEQVSSVSRRSNKGNTGYSGKAKKNLTRTLNKSKKQKDTETGSVDFSELR